MLHKHKLASAEPECRACHKLIDEGGTDLDFAPIRDAVRGMEGPLSVTFHPGQGESPLTPALAEVVETIRQAAGTQLTVECGEGAGILALPALTLCGRNTGHIHYLALPDGPESAPFLDALADLARGSSRDDSELARQLQPLTEPAELLVFIAAACPHCPRAARAANQIAAASPLITTSIIDAQHFPELAQRFSVRSVPLTILDRRLFLTGVIPASNLADRILARGTERYEADLFRSLLEEGRVDEATAHLGSGGAGAHFVSAWRDSTTSSRMGLLLVAENALAADPVSLDGMVSDLLLFLRSEDGALRGDTADLLGRIGHTAAEAELTQLLDDPNPDVAEVASDALEQLRERAES